jgi:hypothetical protein
MWYDNNDRPERIFISIVGATEQFIFGLRYSFTIPLPSASLVGCS